MIYRLKAPTRKDIEEALPFDLYRWDEEGNLVLVPATEEYSYVFRGHKWETEPEYDEEGSLVTEGVLTDDVYANINVYIGNPGEIPQTGLVDRVFPNNPDHGWT